MDDAEYLDKDFSEVLITSNDVILSEDVITSTPTMEKGLTLEEERCLRIHCTQRIHSAGMLLKLGITNIATAQVIFHRFFYKRSFVDYEGEQVAMAALFVSSKMESRDEHARKMRDVMNVFRHIDQVCSGKTIRPMRIDINYANLKKHLSKIELLILKDLGYCISVNNPHRLIPVICQILGLEKKEFIVQAAFNHLNDSYHTDVCVRYSSEVVACACIHLTSLTLKYPLPNDPGWWLLFSVKKSDMEDISRAILSLYEGPKGDLKEIQSKIRVIKSANAPQVTLESPPSQLNTPGDQNNNNNSNNKEEEASSEDSRIKVEVENKVDVSRSDSKEKTPDKKEVEVCQETSERKRKRSVSHKRKLSEDRRRSRSPRRHRSRDVGEREKSHRNKDIDKEKSRHRDRDDNLRDKGDRHRDREDYHRDKDDYHRDRGGYQRNRDDYHRDKDDYHRDRDDYHRDRDDYHRPKDYLSKGYGGRHKDRDDHYDERDSCHRDYDYRYQEDSRHYKESKDYHYKERDNRKRERRPISPIRYP